MRIIEFQFMAVIGIGFVPMKNWREIAIVLPFCVINIEIGERTNTVNFNNNLNNK